MGRTFPLLAGIHLRASAFPASRGIGFSPRGTFGDCILESRVPEGPRFFVQEPETQTAAAERLITAQELGELLQLSTDTVLDWFEDGKLAGYRLGGKKGGPVRFRLSEIEGLLEGWRVPVVALAVREA